MGNMVKKVLKVAHHRNGSGYGEGFYAVTFKDKPNKANMVAIVFEGKGQCAVLDIDLLAQGKVEFGVNSWRGDDYEPELRQAIEEYEASRAL